MEKHFGLAYQISFQSNSLLELQNFCTDCMTKSPQKIFKSLDFTSLSEKSLVSLIKSIKKKKITERKVENPSRLVSAKIFT